MGLLLKSLLLAVVLLFYFCECQHAEDFIQMKLDAILEAQSTIIRRLDEQKRKQDIMDESLRSVKQTFEESLQSVKLTVEESLQSVKQTVEDLRVEYQQCAQRDQVDIFQNILSAGQQEIVSSLQQCPCIDQIADMQDLLTTDECSNLSHNCSQMAMCSDTPGSYKCTCLPGYSGDGFECHDIDECRSEQQYCATEAKCTNLLGTYDCQCRHPLYVGDGYTCDNVCESPSIYIGGIGCIKLISSKGIFSVEEGLGSKISFETAKEKCKEQPGGGKLLENITVEHVKILSQHFIQIGGYDPFIGVIHSKWITSGLAVDSNLWMDGQPDGGSQIYGFLDLVPPEIGLRDDFVHRYALCQFSLD